MLSREMKYDSDEDIDEHWLKKESERVRSIL